MQAAEFLAETGAHTRTIIVFSDMQEELDYKTVRDFPIKLDGIRIIALNVTKLDTDNVDPRRYVSRLEWWEERARAAGATRLAGSQRPRAPRAGVQRAQLSRPLARSCQHRQARPVSLPRLLRPLPAARAQADQTVARQIIDAKRAAASQSRVAARAPRDLAAPLPPPPSRGRPPSSGDAEPLSPEARAARRSRFSPAADFLARTTHSKVPFAPSMRRAPLLFTMVCIPALLPPLPCHPRAPCSCTGVPGSRLTRRYRSPRRPPPDQQGGRTHRAHARVRP